MTAKKKILPGSLEEAINSLAIQDVYLSATETFIAEDFDPKFNEQQLAIQYRHGPRECKTLFLGGEDSELQVVKFLLETAIRFTVETESPANDVDAPLPADADVKAEIRASFVVEYVVTTKAEPSKEALKLFGATNAFYHAWPYWREYAQNMCMRMRLPDFIMPMFRLPQKDEE